MLTLSLDEFKKLSIRRRLKKMRKSLIDFVDVMNHVKNRIKIDYIAVTLTYRDIESYSSTDIRRYINSLSVYCKRKGIKIYGYAWVLEFQKRGVAHYHILLAVNKGAKIPYPDGSWWSGGLSQVKRLNKITVWYLAKYMSKMTVEDYEAIKLFMEYRQIGKLRLWCVVMRDYDLKEYYRFARIPDYLRDINIYLFQKPFIYDNGKWMIQDVKIGGDLQIVDGIVIVSSYLEYGGKSYKLDEIFSLIDKIR